MKAKKILLAILAIVIVAVALIFLYGSSQPKEVSLERSIVINRSPELVYSYVSDFRNWKEWSAWNLRDTTMEVSYGGSDSGKGAEMSWTSKDSGNGKQTVTAAEPYSMIDTELDFGSMGSAKSGWKFEKVDDGTKVTWDFSSETGGPFVRGLMALFFDMEAAVGKDYEEGLKNLKDKVESLPEMDKVNITEEDINGFYYLGVVKTASMSDMKEIGDAYSNSYVQIGNFLKKAKMESSGPPLCIMHEYDNEKMTFEPALMVSKLPPGIKNPIEGGEVKAGKVVKGIYHGDYSKMGPTYEAIEKYVSDKGYKLSGKTWEVYVTDPGLEKDTTKWETHIYYPVSM